MIVMSVIGCSEVLCKSLASLMCHSRERIALSLRIVCSPCRTSCKSFPDLLCLLVSGTLSRFFNTWISQAWEFLISKMIGVDFIMHKIHLLRSVWTAEISASSNTRDANLGFQPARRGRSMTCLADVANSTGVHAAKGCLALDP